MALRFQCKALNSAPPTNISDLPPQLASKSKIHPPSSPASKTLIISRRACLSILTATTFLGGCVNRESSSKPTSSPGFEQLPDSGGVKFLDLRVGDDGGESPVDGDKVSIHFYGRLAAKQGWRFDSTYDHKDENGEPVPFQFLLGSGKVIPGIESAVRSMKVGGIRRVVIPPSQGYQNTFQEPIPPNAEAFYYNLQPHTFGQRRRLHVRDPRVRYRTCHRET